MKEVMESAIKGHGIGFICVVLSEIFYYEIIWRVNNVQLRSIFVVLLAVL